MVWNDNSESMGRVAILGLAPRLLRLRRRATNLRSELSAYSRNFRKGRFQFLHVRVKALRTGPHLCMAEDHCHIRTPLLKRRTARMVSDAPINS